MGKYGHNGKYKGTEGFVAELGATVRECIDCGCLTPGGPTRCKRCADFTVVKGKPWLVRMLYKLKLRW